MNVTCVSSQQKEIFNSTPYKLTLFFNLFITFLSFIFTIVSIFKLLTQSIIQFSTKIFLLSSLYCVLSQDFAYFKFKFDIFKDIILKYDDSCIPYYKITDCNFIIRGLLIASSGLLLIQLSMSFDRIFQLFFSKVYTQLNIWPSVIFASFAVISSYFVYDLLTIGDPLKGQVLSCAQFSPKSYDNYVIFNWFLFYFSIGHMIVDLLILKIVMKRARKTLNTFTMIDKYRSRESLRSTQHIVALSTIQFTAQVTSSLSTKFLVTAASYLNSYLNAITAALIYTMPYFCLAHPILIIVLLRRTRIQRQKSIEKMRSHKETQEDYIRRIKNAWA